MEVLQGHAVLGRGDSRRRDGGLQRRLWPSGTGWGKRATFCCASEIFHSCTTATAHNWEQGMFHILKPEITVKWISTKHISTIGVTVDWLFLGGSFSVFTIATGFWVSNVTTLPALSHCAQVASNAFLFAALYFCNFTCTPFCNMK